MGQDNLSGATVSVPTASPQQRDYEAYPAAFGFPPSLVKPANIRQISHPCRYHRITAAEQWQNKNDWRVEGLLRFIGLMLPLELSTVPTPPPPYKLDRLEDSLCLDERSAGLKGDRKGRDDNLLR